MLDCTNTIRRNLSTKQSIVFLCYNPELNLIAGMTQGTIARYTPVVKNTSFMSSAMPLWCILTAMA